MHLAVRRAWACKSGKQHFMLLAGIGRALRFSTIGADVVCAGAPYCATGPLASSAPAACGRP